MLFTDRSLGEINRLKQCSWWREISLVSLSKSGPLHFQSSDKCPCLIWQTDEGNNGWGKKLVGVRETAGDSG